MKKTMMKIFPIILMSFLILTLIPTYAANISESETKAAALKQLGLFKGVSASETVFDLDRAPTRVEALIMLIRTLGKESEALNGSFTHPFTDVPLWADQYIGYAYEKGLTKGVSATKLGNGSANSDMYLTFILRALGYSDTAGDFKWDAPEALAKAVGILPDDVDTVNFKRADIVLVSWAALEANFKGEDRRLAKKLLSEGVFTGDDYASAIMPVNEQKTEPVFVSSADTLRAALADKTVKSITIDSVGTPVVISGELTIPAGITLTINRGNDFYIEGTLTNNGIINVPGADSYTTDFINYSVMAVQNGGKVINNGRLGLCASVIGDEEDRGPVGGQLRVFDGSFENNGSVYLETGRVNTHGGMVVIDGGTFTNSSTVVVNGFFLRIVNGSFVNNKDAVVINTSTIQVDELGTFKNNGTLSGHEPKE